MKIKRGEETFMKGMKCMFSMMALFSISLVFAQDNVLLKGYVLDKENSQPLSLAAVQIKNSQLGALTEDNGYFELPLPKSSLTDSLRISFIGYEAKTISVSDYQAKDTLRIILETQVATKDEVVVTAMNARGVLLKAIDNLRKNIYTDSIIQRGLYRQYHKENGKYVRLIEADVSIAFNTKSPYKYSFHELIQTNKVRRSENFETNGDIHGDHLTDLLKENPFSYNKGTLLNPKMLDFLSPKFESEDSAQYIIRTQYKDKSSAKLEKAKFWIQKETFAILKIEIEKFPNPYYVRSRYELDSRWKLVNESDVIILKNIGGKYFVTSLQRTYNHHVLNRQTGQVDFIVEEVFELYFDEFTTKNVGEILTKGNFLSMSSLYDSYYKYDENFWKTYSMVNLHKTPSELTIDLDKVKNLNLQFRDAGKIIPASDKK
ncbi:MAG: carboxypeptidase-like regulatory domain-containing protein [Bacteroidetes bacterium]|nr:carboxypeptidase-like regulatory domain-containing protein [Bacteroidota bacterium]